MNRDVGMIQALNAGAAVAVKVSYKTKAVSGIKISGATEITKPRRITVDGVNLATNERSVRSLSMRLLLRRVQPI